MKQTIIVLAALLAACGSADDASPPPTPPPSPPDVRPPVRGPAPYICTVIENDRKVTFYCDGPTT